jgi:hypothetical protein
MTNDIVALPNLNRRSALAKLSLGLAASTSLAATAIAAPEAGVSPVLLRLIEAHRKAAEENTLANRADEEADTVDSGVDGATLSLLRTASAITWDRQKEAIRALCSHGCATDDDQLVRLRYVATLVDELRENVCFTDDLPKEIELLFASIRAEA